MQLSPVLPNRGFYTGEYFSSSVPSKESFQPVSSSSVDSSSGFSDFLKEFSDMFTGDYQERMQKLQEQAAEKAFAREQHSAQTAMDFSAAEAQKNRDWQTEMSNTAHQRQMADLKAAGLNPILAATGGAFTGSGAVASGFSSSGHKADVDVNNQLVDGFKVIFGAINSVSGLLSSISDLMPTKIFRGSIKK